MLSPTGIIVIVVTVYMIGMLVIGKMAEKRSQGSADEYLVAGRNMPLWMVTATLFATWWGAETVMGASGKAYEEGMMSTLYDPWACGAGLIIAGLFYMKVCRDMKLRSMGSFYRYRFGQATGVLASYTMVPSYILWLACQMLAVGKVFQVILGWPIWISTTVGALIIIYYTYSGGMLAVAWTDFVQMLIILVGLIIIVPVSINAARGWHVIQGYRKVEIGVVYGNLESRGGGGAVACGGLWEAFSNHPGIDEAVKKMVDKEFHVWRVVKKESERDFWQFFPRIGDWEKWLWWLAVVLSISLGNIPGPDLMQRAFIAKDSRTAQICGVISGSMYWVLGFLPVIAALCFRALVGEGIIPASDAAIVAGDGELLIPKLAMAVFPPILIGIFTAGLLSAIMSSADSSLFASTAIISNDLAGHYYQKWYGKKIDDKTLYKVSRLGVIFTGLAALVITFFADSLYRLLIMSIVYIWHVLFFPFTLGIYWKKCNAYGALAGMAVGMGVFLLGCFLQPDPDSEDWLWMVLPAFCSGVTIIIASLLTQKRNPPLPLISEDGVVLKWPELAKDLSLQGGN